MDSKQLRQSFFDYFQSKQHKIVLSAPMVIKDDPTLMFTNAGMNQFKDIFLANKKASFSRVANSQKCLRVSGKHNDLEEVGHDTYHHTMFEMLGNWSFNDYFKKEAIEYAWDYLVNILKIEQDRLYATVFEGDPRDKTNKDDEAMQYWKQFLPDSRILPGSKKDNFWEMGDTGPCGPCSEVHLDLRADDERKHLDGSELVNMDHPRVIEIWNLVFIQFNRKANGDLEMLPQKHIDTGMGFERLCMAIQGKTSNYDTDLFQRIIQELSQLSGIQYGVAEKQDIAMRVVSDHLRAVSFSIADGQLPSNNKAGYVIRRILRRAVRYYYTYLNLKEPVIFKLLPALIDTLGGAYPELVRQQELISNAIKEEELSFLRTLDNGIRLLDSLIDQANEKGNVQISGRDAFVLYDTYGFPLDLTELILKEKGLKVDIPGFEEEMNAQKKRAKSAAAVDMSDWVVLQNNEEQEFVGYDILESDVMIARYRKVKGKGKEQFQLIFNRTPFYGESGGQIGDTGFLVSGDEKIKIVDTKKENNLIVHITNKLPSNPSSTFKAIVDKQSRFNTANNHSATHLLHHALRKVLGEHVEQKGSLVHPDYLRFDFSHFQKLSKEEMREIEHLVNQEIRENHHLEEHREIEMNKARNMGAMALFGEKYGEVVRVIRFGDSVELCGGTHAHATGNIGFFKIISESSIAAGIRRIEAISGEGVEKYLDEKEDLIENLQVTLKAKPDNILSSIENTIKEREEYRKKLEELLQKESKFVKEDLMNSMESLNGINVIVKEIDLDDAAAIKDISFQLKNEVENLFMAIGARVKEKPLLSLMISENLIKQHELNAGKIIREIAKEIQGGGGGQPFYATAGGKKPEGIKNALQKAKEYIKNF
jgi:alanyl-tRNA synthetase